MHTDLDTKEVACEAAAGTGMGDGGDGSTGSKGVIDLAALRKSRQE